MCGGEEEEEVVVVRVEGAWWAWLLLLLAAFYLRISLTYDTIAMIELEPLRAFKEVSPLLLCQAAQRLDQRRRAGSSATRGILRLHRSNDLEIRLPRGGLPPTPTPTPSTSY